MDHRVEFTDEQIGIISKLLEDAVRSTLLKGKFQGIGRLDFQIDGILFMPSQSVSLREVKVKEVFDTLIRVREEHLLFYRHMGIKTFLHPELQPKEESEFDFGDIEKWTHEKQDKGFPGGELLEYFESSGQLNKHLALADLAAILSETEDNFYRKNIGSEAYAWKSVFLNKNGEKFVPYISREKSPINGRDYRYIGSRRIGTGKSTLWEDREGDFHVEDCLWYNERLALRFK